MQLPPVPPASSIHRATPVPPASPAGPAPGAAPELDPSRCALVMIDMQNGFIDPASSLCIAGAAATVDACAAALGAARAMGMPIYYAVRRYAADGSDVEATRLAAWSRDRALSPACAGPHCSDAMLDALAPLPDDVVLVKPRFSAFFGTSLDVLLRRRRIDTVVLAGTTTPNCVRSTCYDALSLDYNVVVLADCTSSRSDEVQRANLDDMAAVGALVLDCARFCERGVAGLPDRLAEARAFCMMSTM